MLVCSKSIKRKDDPAASAAGHPLHPAEPRSAERVGQVPQNEEKARKLAWERFGKLLLRAGTFPQLRQWCLRLRRVKPSPHCWHSATLELAFQVEVSEFWEKARTFTISEPNKSLKEGKGAYRW